jgi:hypothetical protein
MHERLVEYQASAPGDQRLKITASNILIGPTYDSTKRQLPTSIRWVLLSLPTQRLWYRKGLVLLIPPAGHIRSLIIPLPSISCLTPMCGAVNLRSNNHFLRYSPDILRGIRAFSRQKGLSSNTPNRLYHDAIPLLGIMCT